MNDDGSQAARLLACLESSNPARDAYLLAQRLRDEGMSQLAIFRLYDRTREQFDDRDPRYDAVLDTMDCIVGYCSPAARLFETYLSKSDIEPSREE